MTASLVACAQRTIRIPQDQATIQAGIDAASDGDTVLVSPGSYKVNLDFSGKAITVTTGAASYDAAAVAATELTPTDISMPIVSFNSSEGLQSVFNGFTLTNGTAIFDPLVTPNYLTYETSIYGLKASPTITNNRFVQGYQGINLEGGEIANNYVTGFVGGWSFGAGHVHDNLFEKNPNGGIGIYGGLFERNIIRNNSAAPDALQGQNNTLVFINGGVFLQNVVYGNFNQFLLALGNSGTGPPTVIVAENTFADNTVSIEAAPPPCGSGTCPTLPPAQIFFEDDNMYPHAGNGSLIVNNIFSTSSPGPAVYCPNAVSDNDPKASDTLQFDHNLFNVSGGPIFDPTCRHHLMASGNTTGSPLFANAGEGDYHLSDGSPAIDSGNNSLLAELASFGDTLSSDFDGKPRPVDATELGYPVLDRGAYEFAGKVDGVPTSLLLTPSGWTPFTSQNFTLTAALSSALGPPQGTILLLKDGVKIASSLSRGDGTAVFNFPAPTVSGTHEFEADYGGVNPFPPATSLKLVLNFALSQTTLSLKANPQSGQPGQAILLTVLAMTDDGSIPSPVALTDNGSALGTLLPDSGGRASLTVTSFTPGIHTVVAKYAGDASHTAASASVVVTILQNDLSIALQPPSVTVRSGQHAQTTVTLTSLGIFAGSLTLSAGFVPQYATLVFDPASVALTAGASASSTLTIDTAEGANGMPYARQEGKHGGSGISLAFGAFALLPFVLRRTRGVRKSLGILLVGATLAAGTGCTTISSALNRVAPGSYVIPVTAVDTATGLSRSTNLTLIVTE